jgi:hypothetical protein
LYVTERDELKAEAFNGVEPIKPRYCDMLRSHDRDASRPARW